MDNIIEKLGIAPIESYKVRNGFFCDTVKVRILEQQRNELIEALIEVYNIQWASDNGINMPWIEKLIEKADSQHRPWDEIKELL